MVDPRVLEVVLINQKFNSTSEYVFFLNFGNVNFEWVATNQYAFSDSLSAHSTFFFHYTWYGPFFTQLLISDSPHLHIHLVPTALYCPTWTFFYKIRISDSIWLSKHRDFFTFSGSPIVTDFLYRPFFTESWSPILSTWHDMTWHDIAIHRNWRMPLVLLLLARRSMPLAIIFPAFLHCWYNLIIFIF